MKAPLRLQVAALALMMAVGLAGCTASGENEEPATDSSSAPSTDSEANDDAEVDPDTSGAADAGIDLDNPPEAIASIEVPVTMDDGTDSMLIEVVGMRHVEDVLVATFRFTAAGEDAGVEPVSLFRQMGLFWPALIDYKNLVRYDSVRKLTTDSGFVESRVGSPMYTSATFAYPEGADTVDISVNSGLPPIADVPVP
ncbi:hypothetical protein LG299_09845 [Microbacterium lacus]|uniref:hypothetical protein n=1 Tax=Microbacterium lacus TaxID=415217 RepID=UPI00384CE895